MGSFTLKCKCIQPAHIACGRITQYCRVMKPFVCRLLRIRGNIHGLLWHRKGKCETYNNPCSQRSQRQMPILVKITCNNSKVLAYDCTGKSRSSYNLPTYWGTEKSLIRTVDNGIKCVFLCHFVFTYIKAMGLASNTNFNCEESH